MRLTDTNPNMSEFTKQELRYLKMAQHYFNTGQSDLVAYSVAVKLMALAGITVDDKFEDSIDRAIRLSQERKEKMNAPYTVGGDDAPPPVVGGSTTDDGIVQSTLPFDGR